MAVFGSVPGLTIFTLAAVCLLGGTYLGVAVYLTHSPSAARTWKVAVLPVVGLFLATTFLALLSTVAENQFVTRITGG